MKNCRTCNQPKSLDDYYRHRQMADGHLNICRDCVRTRVKLDRAKKLESKRAYDLHRYRYRFSRFFDARYQAIRARVRGETGNPAHKRSSAYGRPTLSKAQFLAWCRQSDNMKLFYRLYVDWYTSDFQARLTPSIDRIDNHRGYELDNIQWLTLSDNASKGDK